MSYYDDEQILATQHHDLGKPKPSTGGRTTLRVIKKEKAPLEETKLKVLLELIGSGSKEEESPGVDIVAVLDVSGSMEHDKKLEKMKTAMHFVIKKLNPAHRLSVVTFSSRPHRECPLRQMNDKAQTEILDLVDSLSAHGGTNISGALRMALQVLRERNCSTSRVAAVMLMSDGDQSRKYEDARLVPVHEVPVFTFGFGRGSEYKPDVLNAIAKHSNGGTFSIAEIEDTESNSLSIAFSQCLAGLLTVVAHDLKLTITPIKVKLDDEIAEALEIESVIEKVSAGLYPQTDPDASGSITVSLGDIYKNETRKVMVDLLLPKIPNDAGTLVLKSIYQYSSGEQLFESPPVTVSVFRTGSGVDKENQQVVDEEKRLETVDKMGRATNLADQNKFPEAHDELKQAQDSLNDVVTPNQLIEMLKYEVGQLSDFMQSPQIYNSKGKHFALASLTSHARQRYAARGDLTKLRLFTTPAMNVLLKQVIKFEEDKEAKLPESLEVEEEEKVMVMTTPVQEQPHICPVTSIIKPLSLNLGAIIQSLKVIQDSLQDIQNLLDSTSQ